MRLILVLAFFTVSQLAHAKDAKIVSRKTSSESIDCQEPVNSENGFGFPSSRATCLVTQALSENSRPDLLAALDSLQRQGYTRPFGTRTSDNLKAVELKADTTGKVLTYSYLVVKPYAKEGRPESFGIQNTILFYVDISAPNSYTLPARVEIKKIVANQ